MVSPNLWLTWTDDSNSNAKRNTQPILIFASSAPGVDFINVIEAGFVPIDYAYGIHCRALRRKASSSLHLKSWAQFCYWYRTAFLGVRSGSGLLKLTPAVNFFTNISRAAFLPTFLHQDGIMLNFKFKIAMYLCTFINAGKIDPRSFCCK